MPQVPSARATTTKVQDLGMFYTGRGDWGAFMNMLQQNMDRVDGWQAKLLLQWFFTMNPFSGAQPLGTMIMGREARKSGNVANRIRNMIGELSQKVGDAGEMPSGWRGVFAYMFPKAGSMQNPYGSKTGLLKAILSDNIFSAPIRVSPGQKQMIPDWFKGQISTKGEQGAFQKVTAMSGHPLMKFMESWNLHDPLWDVEQEGTEPAASALDAFAPMYRGLRQEQNRYLSKKALAEYRRTGFGGRGGGFLDAIGFGLANFAMGGVLGSVGSALSGGGAAAGALAAPVSTGGAAAELGTLTPTVSGMGPGVRAGMGTTLPPMLPAASPTLFNRLGQGMEWLGEALAPSLKGSFGSFGTPGPPRISGTKDIKFPYIAGGEKGVPSYWPEKWKKESLWERMWGEYPEELREELRQSLFEKNPYGYGDQFWTPPRGMRAWGF